MAHYSLSRHPVAAKLGTITPEGTADVFCYDCNEERIDSHLARHLAHVGINIAGQEKTVQSLTEMVESTFDALQKTLIFIGNRAKYQV